MLRTSTNGQVWSEWRPVVESEDMSDHEMGTFAALIDGNEARWVDVDAPEGIDPSSIVLSAINTRDGPKRTIQLTRSANASTPQPNVISRAAWGADESIRKGTPSFSRVRKLFVHHTVTSNNDSDPAARIRAIYAMHVQSNGWNDIGYNFLIDANGNVYEGRYSRAYDPGEIPKGENRNGLGVIGAHVSGHNTFSAGIAMLGTFTDTSPTAAARQALVNLLAWKADRHGIHPLWSDLYTNGGTSRTFPNIAGHRDVDTTACPGTTLWSALSSIRSDVENRIQSLSGQTAPDMPTGTQLMPQGGSRDLTPNATGAVSRSATRVAITFDGSKLLNDRTISVGAGNGSFALGDGDFAGTPLKEDTYEVRAVSFDAQGRSSPAAPVASGYGVYIGDLPASGYWIQGTDGGVFTYGSAGFYGSMGGQALRAPVVGMASTPSGNGYWLVASDGGIFTFGDGGFYGSTGAMSLRAPVRGMARTVSGNGYWLVASDGGIFTFGDGGFYGSMGATTLAQPVVGMARTKSGNGYWMVGADGGIFTFGDGGYHGSLPGRGINATAVSMAATFTGDGYYIIAKDGSVFTFGDAPFYGSPPSQGYRMTARGAALVK